MSEKIHLDNNFNNEKIVFFFICALCVERKKIVSRF